MTTFRGTELEAMWHGNQNCKTSGNFSHHRAKTKSLAASIRNFFNTQAQKLSSKSLAYNSPLPGRSLYGELRN